MSDVDVWSCCGAAGGWACSCFMEVRWHKPNTKDDLTVSTHTRARWAVSCLKIRPEAPLITILLSHTSLNFFTFYTLFFFYRRDMWETKHFEGTIKKISYHLDKPKNKIWGSALLHFSSWGSVHVSDQQGAALRQASAGRTWLVDSLQSGPIRRHALQRLLTVTGSN